MNDANQEAKRPRRRLAMATLKNCTRLNVRSGPSGDAHVNGVITDRDRIKVDVATKDREWVTIYEPIYGFAKKDYLEVK